MITSPLYSIFSYSFCMHLASSMVYVIHHYDFYSFSWMFSCLPSILPSNASSSRMWPINLFFFHSLIYLSISAFHSPILGLLHCFSHDSTSLPLSFFESTFQTPSDGDIFFFQSPYFWSAHYQLTTLHTRVSPTVSRDCTTIPNRFFNSFFNAQVKMLLSLLKQLFAIPIYTRTDTLLREVV